MLRRADAALVIGDNALAIDAAAYGVTKIDLGAEWKALTGLPFVYAAWTGRPGAASREHCEALQAARDRGVAAAPEIARAAGAGDPASRRGPCATCVIISNWSWAMRRRPACGGSTSSPPSLG